jgi:hypothetical protein
MKEVEKSSNIPPNGQKLIYKGKVLKPEEPITTYKIENDITIILIKTAKAENNNNGSGNQSSSQENTSNNQEMISLKIKTNIDATIHNIQINKNASVLGLKGEIEKVTHVPPNQQKIIANGRAMKDSEALSSYNLENDQTIAMARVGGEPQPQPLPNIGGGGLGGLNQGMTDQQIETLLNNQEVVDIMFNVPEVRQIIESNPDAKKVLENPITRRLVIREILKKGGLSNKGFQDDYPDDSEISNISVSKEPNTRLGECFSIWIDDEKNGRFNAESHTRTYSQSQPSSQQHENPNVDYKEKYKDQIAQIKDMGIDDEEKIIDVLKKSGGSVQYALNILFEESQ